MSASQHEYYIRQPSDTEARGPFTHEQLANLAATGGLDSRTLFFDALNEQWLPLSDSDDLKTLLPKPAQNKPAQNTPAQNASASPSPASATSPAQAPFASGLVSVFLLASAIALILPSLALLRHADFRTLFHYPIFWFGVLDLLLALAASLWGPRLRRVVRIRAGLGFGFLCVLMWLHANIAALIAAAIFAICLWLATYLATRRNLLLNATAGLAALVVLAYCLLS